MPLSPHTWLSSPVDSTTTTFNVYDTNVFPTPPFYAVLLDGARTETVRITQVGSGVLSGIVRGVEGIASSHPVDTPLARNFCAADHDDLIDNVEYLFASHVIGVQWDRDAEDTTALTWIDVDGNPVTSLPFGSFDNHRTYREIKRCLLSTTGTPTFGTNARGDGLTLDGTMGRVMVAIPKFWVKADHPSANIYRWWISPIAISGFEVHPAFHQRGGIDREYIYVGAYQANLHTRDFPAHSSTTLALHSRTGEQPATGGQGGTYKCALRSMAFTSGGTTAPTIGETVTGATSGATGVIVDWAVTAGTWAAGDAAGLLILRLVSGTFASENLNGSAAGSNFATGAATGNVQFSIAAARIYAENIGTGWGLMNIWTHFAVVLLMMIERQTMNMQASLGRGIVDLPLVVNDWGGLLNGHGSADSMIAPNGTGTGLGTNGQTPVVWRGIENPWGNAGVFLDGAQSSAGLGQYDYRVKLTPRAGTVPVGTPTIDSCEISVGTISPYAASGGYATNLLWEPLTRLVFMPVAVGGSAGTYLCDAFLGPSANSIVTLGMGGAAPPYAKGDHTGPFGIGFSMSPTGQFATQGARLEYVGAEGGSPTTTTVPPGGGGDEIVIPAPLAVTTPSIVPQGVSSTTPPPAATNPSSPNTDPPVYVVPAQTVQDGSLLGGSFGYGYNPDESGVVIKWDAGILNVSATSFLMTGQTTAKAGKSFTTSFGYQLFRQPTGYGSTGYISAGIPQGATVTGFTVKRYGSYTGASPATGRDLKLFLRFTDPDTPGGWIDSDDYAKTTTNWQYHSEASHGIYLTSYGGESDLWGLDPGVITPAILNNGGVQVVLQVESLANGGTAGVFRLYALQVEITYEV